MSYNIVKTDGTPLATVADGQTNSTASSLTLIGKNYAGYGTFLNENFIRLLENFASASAPLNPLVGQLWWKADTRLLQVRDKFGTWKTISGAQSSSDAPENAIAGDLWFDTVNQQLKVYGGVSWIVIGPSFTATTGTSGAIADTVIDTSLISHVVVKFFVQNQLLGILSKDAAFTPNSTLPGFATVKPGFNLATDRTPALNFNENANNAAYLGGIIASNYLTKGNPVIETQLEIQNPDGLVIQENDGTVDYFEINVAANNVNLASLLRGNGLIIKTKPDNAGGLSINAITIDRTTGLVTVNADPTGVLGVATKGYVDTNDTAIKGFISSNVNTINDTVNTLRANTTAVYGNVRILQSELGIVGGPISGFANTAPWTQITGPSGSGGAGQSIAGNLVALWANVADIHGRVLSNQGIAPGATASLYSNVELLQDQVQALGTDSLARNGSRSVLGTLLPETGQSATYDLGSSTLRFRDVFARTVDLSQNITAGGTITASGVIRSTSTSFTGIAVGTTLNRPDPASTGYIRYNTTLQQFEGYGTAWSSLGGVRSVDGLTYIQAETSAGNSNGDLDFYVENGAGSTSHLLMTGDAARIAITPESAPDASSSSTGALQVTGGVGITKKLYVGDRVVATYLDAGAAGTSATLQGSWTLTAGSKIDLSLGTLQSDTLTTGASGTEGIITGSWTISSGSKLQATYSDLAERFAADADYPVGTVLKIGGTHEVTLEDQDASTDVLGVVSHDFAYLMNTAAGDNSTHPAIALVGRVPVRVVGTVKKGQRIVSAGNGCARAVRTGDNLLHAAIGRALEDKDTDSESLVLCIVKVN